MLVKRINRNQSYLLFEYSVEKKPLIFFFCRRENVLKEFLPLNLKENMTKRFFYYLLYCKVSKV